MKGADIPISLLDLFRHLGQAGEDDVEVGEFVESLASVISPEQVGQLEFFFDVAEEAADVLLLEGGDVVRPVDDPLQDLARGDDDDDDNDDDDDGHDDDDDARIDVCILLAALPTICQKR